MVLKLIMVSWYDFSWCIHQQIVTASSVEAVEKALGGSNHVRSIEAIEVLGDATDNVPEDGQ